MGLNSLYHQQKQSHFYEVNQLIQGIMKTLLKDKHLFNNCFSFPFLPFFFLRQENYLKFIFPQIEDQNHATIHAATKMLLFLHHLRGFSLISAIPGWLYFLTTEMLFGPGLREYRDQDSYCLISDYLISMSIAGATGQNSLTCFRSPNKILSDIY